MLELDRPLSHSQGLVLRARDRVARLLRERLEQMVSIAPDRGHDPDQPIFSASSTMIPAGPRT